jgi:hypothetical protein
MKCDKALWMLLGMICMVAVISALVPGCAQQTTTPVGQLTGQETVTPTTTDQDAATQGSQVYVYLFGPGYSGPEQPVILGGGVTTELGLGPNEIRQGVVVPPDSSEEPRTVAGNDNSASSMTVTITTGGTAPSLTGTTTGTATASQTPTASPVVTPTQDVRPRTAIDIPVGVAMPGGIASPSGGATAGEGTLTQTVSPTNRAAAAWLQGVPTELWSNPDFWSGLQSLVAGLTGETPVPQDTGGTPVPQVPQDTGETPVPQTRPATE